MKKFFLLIVLLPLVLATFHTQSAPPPGYEQTYWACGHVYDQDGNKESGVRIRFVVNASSSDGRHRFYRDVYGTTNSNGYFSLCINVPYDEYPDLIYMMAVLADERYTLISVSNNYSTCGTTIYPRFDVRYDTDHDEIPDEIEIAIAEKFKPVLHKHSYDLSQGLADFEKLLIDGHFTLKVYNNLGQQLWSGNVAGSPEALHKWETWHWDTYGAGSESNEVYNLDLENNMRYQGAAVGQRPIYYHVYKEGSYYYVQYWYYFGMNDISTQTSTWHESDWEHVSIKLTKNGSIFTPEKVNFYTHEGGKTVPAYLCWWSTNNNTSYLNTQQGYDENHKHLHIWIAANAHASYNRYSLVLRTIFRLIPGAPLKDYIDRVDYYPSGNDLYFPYDQLIKLGEVVKEYLVECPDSGYKLGFHSYPVGPGSKHWLAYRGKLGDFNHTGPPFMPAKNPSNPSHEWMDFTDSPNFGNSSTWYNVFFEVDNDWVFDDATGD